LSKKVLVLSTVLLLAMMIALDCWTGFTNNIEGKLRVVAPNSGCILVDIYIYRRIVVRRTYHTYDIPRIGHELIGFDTRN
jgi:hypothetical protein